MKLLFIVFFAFSSFFFAASIQAAEKGITILYLGDSLTEGFGIEPDEAYPALVEKMLLKAGHTGIKTVNGGYSGSTTASASSRLQWYSRVKPDIVVLALGANDGLRGLPPKAMQASLAKAIEFANSKGINVLLCGMMAPPNYGKEYTEKFKGVFERLAKEHQVSFIPFLLKGVAGDLGKNLPDGIHPNAEGHKVISETVFKPLEEMLR